MRFLKKYKLLLVLPLLFSSCSNDSSGKKNPGTGNDFTLKGVYVGTMKITKGDGDFEADLTDQLVYIEETNDQNTIRLALKDFMVNDVEYGSIMMPAVYEKKKDGNYNLDGYSGLVPIEPIGETTLVLTGSLTSEYELSFDVEGVVENSKEVLNVSFIGSKTDIVLNDYYFNFENWQIANPTAANNMQYSLPVSDIIGLNWSSTDGEVYRWMRLGQFNQFTVGQNSEGWGDRLSVQIRTVESQKGINEQLLPRIYSGLFYLGTFQDKVTPPHAGIRLGMPFDEEPLSVKGGFRYKPGKIYYECIDPTRPANVVVNEDLSDACLIEAFLYQVSSSASESEVLTLNNIRSSDRVVARGSFSTDKAVDSFEEFEFNFRWNDGVSYDANQDYRLVILATASKEGEFYSGAPGSTLLIDNLRITTRK